MSDKTLIKELSAKIETLTKNLEIEKQLRLTYKELVEIQKENYCYLERENKKLILFSNISFN